MRLWGPGFTLTHSNDNKMCNLRRNCGFFQKYLKLEVLGPFGPHLLLQKSTEYNHRLDEENYFQGQVLVAAFYFLFGLSSIILLARTVMYHH